MADIFAKVGFISGWVGVLCCILSFIFLTLKAREQVIKFKKSKNNDIDVKDDNIFLLLFAFGCTIFTFIQNIYYATIGSDPNRLHIHITRGICQYTAQYMANAGWQLSRYCFYNFMLWRIKASFREPQSLKLSQITFVIYFTLIHLWLVFVLCISIFLTPRKYTASGECFIVVNKIFNNFTTADIRSVAWAFDFCLTVALLFLFLKRFYQLTQRNERINKYKRKTIILGVTATLTSIIMALVIYFMTTKEWRFFISMDLIVNLSCVVFTYKISVDALCPDCYRQYKNSHCNGDTVKHSVVNQESTISQQPNDSQVWRMLVKSQHELHDVHVHDVDVEVDCKEMESDGRSCQTQLAQNSQNKTDVELEKMQRN